MAQNQQAQYNQSAEQQESSPQDLQQNTSLNWVKAMAPH
jgi:hypothetical protein